MIAERDCLPGAWRENIQMFAFVNPSIKHMIMSEGENHTVSG